MYSASVSMSRSSDENATDDDFNRMDKYFIHPPVGEIQN